MQFSFRQPQVRTACLVLGLSATLLFSIAADAQTDSVRTHNHNRYVSFTPLTGAGVQFFGATNRPFSVSFPYRMTDASGSNVTNANFIGTKTNVFPSPKYYLFPFGFELGRRHNLVHLAASFSLIKGAFGVGGHVSIGYGRIWYLGRYAIKLSLDLARTSDPADGHYNLLGTIDNKNRNIYLFGQILPYAFNVPSSNGIPAHTFNVNNLDITYSQAEWSLMPGISILPNPLFHHHLYEFTIGYNLPIQDRGNLYFIQVSGDGKTHFAAEEDITNNLISVSYNKKPVKDAPFRFGGIYIELIFNLVGYNK